MKYKLANLQKSHVYGYYHSSNISFTPAYTFRENYCFAAGDHAIDSQDSRYLGLLPEKFIVGVAQFVWKSGEGIRKVRK